MRILCSIFLGSSLLASAAPLDWPQWRGPHRDGYASEGSRVPATLPPDLKPAWRKSIGGGFSGPVVTGGRLFYLDEAGGQEIAHCVDASSGAEVWKLPFAEVYQDEWGAGPRATPFI